MKTLLVCAALISGHTLGFYQIRVHSLRPPLDLVYDALPTGAYLDHLESLMTTSD